MVHREERLPFQSVWIDRVAKIETAAKVHLSDSVKSRCLIAVLCIGRAKAVKRAAKVDCATDKEIAVCIDVQCSPHD